MTFSERRAAGQPAAPAVGETPSPGQAPADVPRRARHGVRRRALRLRGSGKGKGQGSFWKELPFLVVLALVLALLIKTFLVQAFFIPSGSMEQTLKIGDRVLVNKLVYRFGAPHRGEVIVFQGPADWAAEVPVSTPANPVVRFFSDIGQVFGVAPPSDRDFIKRVIGVPGDVVACCTAGHQITVNGHPLNEPYVYLGGPNPSSLAWVPFRVTVPKGHLWVMGDHRNDSADSRAHETDASTGTIPISDVIGRAFVRVWPASRWGTLPVPKTFQPSLATRAVSLPGAPAALGAFAVAPLGLVRWRRRARR